MSQIFTTADLAQHLGCSERKARKVAKELSIGWNLGGPAGFRYTADEIQRAVDSLRPAPPVQRRRRRRAA